MDLSIFKPQGHAIALEPRIMFDGAAAVAVDQHHADTTPATADRAIQQPAAVPRAAADAAPAPTPAAPAVPQQLLVVDSRVDQRDLLTSQPLPGVKVLVVGTGEDGLAAISNALAQMGHVDSIQILSHGAAGQFTLGNRTVSSDNVDQLASTLQSWRTALTPGADIQLYGCDVGAGAAGQQLVNELARWTGADVGASRDDTGSAAAGGNWTLETVAGTIDKPLALSAGTVAAFDGLLANAAPTVSLSAAGDNTILGGDVTFTASFTNPSTQTGYAPYIDLFIPATGKDGAGAEEDDGLTFVSATYLGQNIRSYVLTFDASGNATHPLARDNTGAPLIIHAADFGMQPGDQFVVLQLPNASIIQNQPPIDIAVTLHLSNLADTTVSDPLPNLTVNARGGFQFGNDPADDPTSDPVLIEAGAHAFVVHPTMVKLSQVVNVPDGGTVTGPNYPRTIVVTAETATDQTLSGVVITQDLPADILVKAITPGANGTLTRVTLYDGRVLTTTADITAAFAAGAYVQNYEVTYATLTGKVDTTISFYVPEVDANGVPVLDPVSGAPVDIPVAAPQASANWTPLDTRDIPTGPLTGSGNTVDFLAQSIAVYKAQPKVTGDVGSPGLSPGDTLTYSLEIDISDYFAFGKNILENGSLVINDLATDGQAFVVGSGTLSVSINGVTQNIPLVATVVHNPDGSTALSLDLAQSLRDAGQALGAMPGDLAFDGTQVGATKAVITYQTTIGHDYTTPYPHDPINEGDTIGNNATVSGTILEDRLNLTGGTASDSDSTTTTIPTSTVDIEIATVNGVAPTGPVELRPGDIVTYTISYDLLVDDYEQFKLSAFLPLPLFDTNIAWTQGSQGSPGIDGTPGTWNFGPGNTNLDTLAAGDVTGGTGNSIIFNYGDFTSPGFNSSRVVLQFTMQVSNTPFGDQRSVTVLAQSDQLTTVTEQHITSNDAVVIQSVAEPVLSITHGVVSSTQGTITGTTGTWNPPGSGGVPFTGSITDPKAVNGDITGIDAGDLLRMATAIENTGGLDAFDVVTTVTLPAGLAFEGGSLGSTLHIYRGNGGPALVEGVDYSVSGNTVSFIDGAAVGALRNGRADTPNDTSGANVMILVYDVRVDAAIPASSTLASTASISAYAASNGGPDFLPATDLTDKANQQVAAPTIAKVFANGTLTDDDSSAAHTTGADLVVGESMLYDVVVTVPEGSVSNLRLDDLVPPGMLLDTTFNGGVGYQIIQTAAGSGALTADFAGTLTAGVAGGLGGTVGEDGVDARLTFSAATVADDNNTGNNSFVIRVRLIASNTLGNQEGRTLANATQLTYSDPDGDVAGGAAVDRVVAMTGPAPTATLREPTLTVAQTHSTVPPIGLDAGDPVSYTITISNNSGVDAFDVSLSDLLPTHLTNLTITSVTPGGTVAGGTLANFAITAGLLQNVGNVDIANGGSIVIVVSGNIVADISGVSTISNTVQVQWTSLDGTPAAPVVERTGVDGPLAGGTLNDYQSSATSDFRVVSKAELSRVGGLADTPAATPDTLGPQEQVAVGEIIRYRANTAIAEGTAGDYTMTITLDQGLEFLNDPGTVRIAFVANGGGISSSNLNLTTSGTPGVIGNETSLLRLPIPADLSGPAPTAVLNIDPSVIDVTTVGGKTVIVFHLGNITNADTDADFEFISLEFNARVSNDTGNVAGKQLGATLVTATAGTVLATSDTVFSDVVEPHFNGVVKQVGSFTPNSDVPSGTADATKSTANVSVRFTQDGTAPAYDVNLVDSFNGVTDYTFTSITIGGTNYLPGALPAGVTVLVSASGITATFDRLDPNTPVVLNYSVSVDSNLAYGNTDAVLTWSSLPETYLGTGGSLVGVVDGTATGERDGSGGVVAPNTYVLREGAGLGLINGTLWDDTQSATTSAAPDGPLLAGQTVTLTWAGADGSFGTGDDATFTTRTDSFGSFHFSALAAGNYRVDAPTPITLAQPTGELRVRIDSDGGTLGQVAATIGEGTQAPADTGYVQRNDAPVNTVPGTQTVDEDATLNVAPITIADVDANNGPAAPGTLDVILSVLHGTLDLSSLPAGVTEAGNGTASMTLSGSLADLNAALALVTYKPIANYNGPDTITVTTRDRGNFGDFDNNGTPGEISDQLQDVDTIPITVRPVNDPPQGVDDATEAIEAGGPFNGVPGVNPTGNLLDNDIDVDLDPILNQGGSPEALHLVSVTSNGVPANTATPNGNTPVEVKGLYGSLFFTANGGYQYVVDNSNVAVQALRLSTDTLTESFNYQLSDIANATATGPTPKLTIVLHGANDTPVGVNDTGAALEAGGTNNGTAGTSATGNVLANDTDVDANGEGKTVTGIRNVPEADAGPLTTVTATGNTVIAGLYGTLTIDATGAYTYLVDQANPTVQALAAGVTLHEFFSYQLTDVGGLNDLAQLDITITGANDNPVATDDTATAKEAGGLNNATPGVNPTGNVLTGGTPDSDLDGPAASLSVSAVRTGAEAGTGTAGTVGTTLAGQFGSLVLNADGSYTYTVDNANAAVQALRLSTNTLVDNFTYTVSDATGGTDTATLAITIQGANDTPVGIDDTGAALEAGGSANGTAGTPATGNVLANDTDVDSVANGEAKNVTGIRNLSEASGGVLTTVGASGNTVIAGLYGTLTIDATGAYTYVVDEANATVQALAAGVTLHEFFTYQVSDVGDPVNGRLSDLAQLDITITGANDNPVATDDTSTALEAGGVNNATPGVNPTGNVLTGGTPDSDLDGPAASLSVSAVRTGAEAGTGTAGTVNTTLAGQFGSLVLNADGSYTYTVDNANAAVQALRLSTNTLVDNFTYTVSDATGGTDTATLAITIQGANDTPVGIDDTGAALEAGGSANGTAGTPATGNVLANDTDVDSVANGEAKNVTGIRNLSEASGGVLTTVGASGNTVIAGLYGTLTIDATGAYTYVVDEANATVQALAAGVTLHEFFTYQVSDVGDPVNGRLSDLAQLDITITGANDNPVATDDTSTALEAGGVNNATPGVNPTGNVLTGGTPDSDLDGPAASLSVSAVRTGAEAGTGTAGTVNTTLAGQFGSLVLNADGSYTYTVDNANAAVQALRLASNTLVDSFTYTVRDANGGTDQATLTVTIQGANDTPVAVNDVATAVEAGGVANGTPGLNPTGNVITPNDTDVDQNGEALSIAGFQQGANIGTVGSSLTGTYGSLVLNTDGSYTYTVDNDNADVQALRTPADSLSEVFTYTLRDAIGATTTATLTVTILGRDDAPVAGDDLLIAQEAGGTFNATPGINPIGNLLSNDSDVDGLDLRTLIGIRQGARDDVGPFISVNGIGPQLIQGRFGDLTTDQAGVFHYVVSNAAAVVERLRAGDTLTDTFTYETRDLFGATDVAQVTVTIQGAWDAPVGVNDFNVAATGTIRNPGLAVDAVGNVLANDTDVDIPDPSKVDAVGVGAEGTATAMQLVAPGTPHVIDGLYGQLTLNADGSYDYKVDLLNLQVLALGPGQFLNEFFTYEVVDNGGLTDLAQLRILVRGQNNAPLSLPDAAAAVEAGGLENSSPGVNPSGNVLADDIDIDGDPMTITGIATAAGSAGTVGQVLRGQWGELLIGADGSYAYTVDNAMPEVEALRVSGQHLVDVFTYTVTDPLGDSNTARLSVTIDGRNDTPIARDDAAVAVEAGGVANTTPGVDPSGNVLDNDTDVDSIANGESKHVAAFSNSAGAGAVAGTTLAGLYGSLTLGADGSWHYAVDNANPVVEAKRIANETLVDSFSYTMADTAGATSQARLVIVVRGADDFPVARNDSNVAADQTPAPQAIGNVLPNDSDMDAGDVLHVAAIRTGAEAESGTAGSIGQALAGRYGTLVIQPDGSYTYSIDLNNSNVLAHAGAGRVLHDVFTYTVADRTGGTDLAELVITLDIAAPYVAPAGHGYGGLYVPREAEFTKYFEPIVFVGPAVERDAIENRISRTLTEGSQTAIVFDRGIQSTSIGEGLGKVSDQYVREAVAESRLASQLDLAQFLTRHGRVSLSADGLLSDPSLFADTTADLTLGPAQRERADSGNNKGESPNGNGRNTRGKTAAAFTEQLRLASQRVGPSWFE